MTKDFGRRFGLDPNMAEAVRKEKNKQVVGIVFGAICLTIGWVLPGILRVCVLGLGLLEVIMSPIILSLHGREDDKRACTYLTVYDDRVEGIAYNDSAVGRPFCLSYDDVVEASLLPENGATGSNNIKIWASSGVYLCYAIEQKGIAVALISEKKAQYEEKKAQEQTRAAEGPVQSGGAVWNVPAAAEPVSESGDSVYCMYCGTKLPKDAAFCYQCGKEQKKL